MNFKTKYNHGDTVYPISIQREEIKVPTNCEVCGDTGEVEIKGKNYTCPKCKGNTYHFIEGEVIWYVNTYDEGIIGNIKIEDYDKKYKRENDNKISYMLDSTGIGSGHVWNEKDLFLSQEEAQKECNKRNYKIKNKIK